MKDRLYFNVTSEKLAGNMSQILRIFDFTPSIYIHKRAKYNWKDLYMVSLTKSESRKLLNFLDKTLVVIGYKQGFSVLKGYKGK